MELIVEPLQQRLHTEVGQNLLEVLRTHGVPISYSCLSGRCGTCRCTVKAGRVLDGAAEARRSPTTHTHEVLACQATLTEDCTIEVPEVGEVIVHPAKIIKATVALMEQVTHDIVRIELRLSKPMEYSPGQYAMLQFTPEHVRPYSMAGLPSDETLEFHVRRVPGGRVTDYIFRELKVGCAVRVSGPLGTAYLRNQHTGPMLCVGGGTGLAPVMSIVRGAQAQGMRNPIHLYVGVRSQQDLYDVDRLRHWVAQQPHVSLHFVVATGDAPPEMRQGLLTDAIEKDHASLQGWRAYVCGSPAMVDALSLLAARKGIDSRHVHADAFYPSGV